MVGVEHFKFPVRHPKNIPKVNIALAQKGFCKEITTLLQYDFEAQMNRKRGYSTYLIINSTRLVFHERQKLFFDFLNHL